MEMIFDQKLYHTICSRKIT